MPSDVRIIEWNVKNRASVRVSPARDDNGTQSVNLDKEDSGNLSGNLSYIAIADIG